MSNQQYTATGYPLPHGAVSAANGYPPGSAGYPYAAPPPNPNHYPNNANPNPNSYYYTQPQYDTARRATFFRRFMAAVISILVILAVILFITWLVLRPRIPKFRINSLSVSHFNVSSSSYVSGNWTAEFTVFNPNSKMHAYYEQLDGHVYYKSERLAGNRLSPFDQETRSEMNLSATFVASTVYVEGWVINGINGDMSQGSIKFDVRIISIVHFKAGGWRTRRRYLRVFCDDLPVGISSKGATGTLTGGPQDCGVSL